MLHTKQNRHPYTTSLEGRLAVVFKIFNLYIFGHSNSTEEFIPRNEQRPR